MPMNDSEYSEKSGQIRQLAALPPDQLINHLSKTHQNLEDLAPNIAPHVHTAAINAVQFLNSKLPGAGNEMLQDNPHRVPRALKNQWLEIHKTVSDPVSVLDRVNDGTVTGHHIDALKSVYPDLHQEMIQKVQDHLGEMKVKGQQVPYQKRMAIAKLIGSPLDSTMTPQAMQAILMAAGPNNGPAATAQKKASGVELKQVNKVSALYQTPDQARQVPKTS